MQFYKIKIGESFKLLDGHTYTKTSKSEATREDGIVACLKANTKVEAVATPEFPKTFRALGYLKYDPKNVKRVG